MPSEGEIMPETDTYVCMNHSPKSNRFKSRAEDSNVKCPKCGATLDNYVFHFSPQENEVEEVSTSVVPVIEEPMPEVIKRKRGRPKKGESLNESQKKQAQIPFVF